MTTETASKDSWGDHASTYASVAPQLTSLHALDFIGLLRSEILQSKRILEIGCGSGAFATAYLQMFPQGIPGQTLIMSDLSNGMLEKAKDAIQPPPNYGTTLQFQQEDGTKLSGIDENSIDLVISMFGVFLIPDQGATQHAITRVLKPTTGIFANASWVFEKSEIFRGEGFGVSLQDTFACPMLSIDPEYSLLRSPWASRQGIEDLLMKEYPFQEVKIHHAIHTSVWDYQMLWSMILQNPMSNMKDASPPDIEKAKETLLSFLDQDVKQPVVLWSGSNLSIARKLQKE